MNAQMTLYTSNNNKRDSELSWMNSLSDLTSSNVEYTYDGDKNDHEDIGGSSSSLIAKYYPQDERDDVINNHTREDEFHLEEGMGMLDLVVHIEEIKSQMIEIRDLNNNVLELNETWRENNSKYVDNDHRVQWIVDETKKKDASNAMDASIRQLQEEMNILSLKSKDLYRYHHQHQVHTQQQQRQQQQKKRAMKRQQRQKRQQYSKLAPITENVSKGGRSFVGPPRRPAMAVRMQTQ